MKVLIIGGLGLQGQAILYDLSKSAEVSEIVCADLYSNKSERLHKILNQKKIGNKNRCLKQRRVIISRYQIFVSYTMITKHIAFCR